MYKPLKGVKVLDMTGVLAGPYSTYQLGLLGAEIIKIESFSNGDWTRTAGKNRKLTSKKMGIPFLIQNSNKKSIQIDLKSKEGKEITLKLLKYVDVFVENMRPGKIDELGFGWNQVSVINKNIVYCSISAFGQDGPFRDRGAYDHVIQGMSGIMSTTGTLESGPTKVGSPYIDYATGLNAAFAIASALYQINIDKKPIHLDVAMFDTSLLLMANMVTEYLNSGYEPKPMGNEAHSGSPSSGMYKTITSPLLLAANTEEQFFNLCNALNTIKIFDKKKWKFKKYRIQKQKELRKEIQEIFNLRTAEELEVLLNKFKVPAGKLRSLKEAVSEEQFLKRKLWNKVNIDTIKQEFLVPGLGFKVNKKSISPNQPPPSLGQDTNEILKLLDYTDEQIKNLKLNKIIN